MQKTTSNLTALEVGHAYALGMDSVSAILSELPIEQLSVNMLDTTVFKFELSNKNYTLINTGYGSLAVRTN